MVEILRLPKGECVWKLRKTLIEGVKKNWEKLETQSGELNFYGILDIKLDGYGEIGCGVEGCPMIMLLTVLVSKRKMGKEPFPMIGGNCVRNC